MAIDQEIGVAWSGALNSRGPLRATGFQLPEFVAQICRPAGLLMSANGQKQTLMWTRNLAPEGLGFNEADFAYLWCVTGRRVRRPPLAR